MEPRNIIQALRALAVVLYLNFTKLMNYAKLIVYWAMKFNFITVVMPGGEGRYDDYDTLRGVEHQLC